MTLRRSASFSTMQRASTTPTISKEEPEVEGELSRSDLRQYVVFRSCSANRLECNDPLNGTILVLARCRERNQVNLSWRSAYFTLSNAGVLRIFRSPEDRARWAELGASCENLAKWRSAISDAHVISCLREVPEPEADKCRRAGRRMRKRSYTEIKQLPSLNEDEETTECETVSISRSTSTSSADDPPQERRPSNYSTFEVWLKNDIANPNACPVLKFSGNPSHDIVALHQALVQCSHHFHVPIKSSFSHPLLRKYHNSPLPVSIST